MSLLARVSFSRDERFLTRAALGGLLGTCTAAVFTAMQGRLSFDGALAGAAVGVLVAATRLPGWVRGFVVAGAFLFFVVMAPPVPVAWVAVFALALMLAVEPRQHWATRVATFFAVVAASLWAWGVTRALSLPHLHAPWLGGLATLAAGLFLGLGAWVGSVRVAPDAMTLRLEAISGASAAWARVRRVKGRLPDSAALTALVTQGAERLLSASHAHDELHVDEQLEQVTRDAVTALTERLAETRDEELTQHLAQTLRVHRDVLEQLDSLKRRKERAAAQVRAHVSWLETVAFSLETAPAGPQALDDVTQRLAKLAPA